MARSQHHPTVQTFLFFCFLCCVRFGIVLLKQGAFLTNHSWVLFLQFDIDPFQLLTVELGINKVTIWHKFKMKCSFEVPPNAQHNFLPKHSWCGICGGAWSLGTQCFRRLWLTKWIHFSLDVTIRFQNSSSCNLCSSCLQISRRRFMCISVNSCGTFRGFLYTKSSSEDVDELLIC